MDYFKKMVMYSGFMTLLVILFAGTIGIDAVAAYLWHWAENATTEEIVRLVTFLPIISVIVWEFIKWMDRTERELYPKEFRRHKASIIWPDGRITRSKG